MHPEHQQTSLGGGAFALAFSGILGLMAFGPAAARAASPPKKAEAAKGDLTAGPVSPEMWLRASPAPLQPGEIDSLILRELRNSKIQPAALTTDEQFIRRVTLDLTGELPMPADVTEFVADKDPRKRAKLIDRLLDSDEFAQHWARYWREVIGSHNADLRGQLLVRHFEAWMKEQLKKNRHWDEMVREMLTATGPVRLDDPNQNGAAYFLGSRFGADANVERAAETSRVFLGIQIQCAQCHDHPMDVWKRQQFHELVAYFSRLQVRPFRDPNVNRIAGVRLFALPRAEYRMPDKKDPKRTTLTHPRFLTGESPGRFLSDRERRQALADSVVSKKNYWFSAAFVNRVWGELMGQSFYMPVDDLGPEKEAVFPTVITRLAGAFRGSDYDVKALFRAVLNSQAYQRQIRPGESADEHLQFAASYPTRLNADALWQSLVNVLGRLGPPLPPVRGFAGPYAGFRGLEGLFKQEFRFDPSTRPDEVEGSITQALLMMNNPTINQRIQARGTNLLARILKAYPRDREAVRMVYLRTLARKPTDREMDRSLKYIQKVGSRAEAFEDLLWALLNSTEFQTRR